MRIPLRNANGTMNLLTKTVLKGVPPLGAQDGKGKKAIAYIKFFMFGHTWFLTELDPETGDAFGMVYSPQCPDGELGYFSVRELAHLSVRGVAVERDRNFTKKPLSECRNPCTM